MHNWKPHLMRWQWDTWSVDTWTFIKRKQYKYDIQAAGMMTKERKSDIHSCSHQTSHWHAAFLIMNTSAEFLNYSPAGWNMVNCAHFGARDFILLREHNYFYRHFSRPALDVSASKDNRIPTGVASALSEHSITNAVDCRHWCLPDKILWQLLQPWKPLNKNIAPVWYWETTV